MHYNLFDSHFIKNDNDFFIDNDLSLKLTFYFLHKAKNKFDFIVKK
jgi:hypothetical protein